MRLLLVTQTIDKNNPVLGFFHEWVVALAKNVEHMEIICLSLGEHSLPDNVRVHSLGKEQGAKSRGAYARKFLSLVWELRGSYDTVFVHMNQEYVLIAGWLWKLLGKPVYMWRNHWAGSFLTDVASAFCKNVFCTSVHSYTAKYKKTILMPVGVDVSLFTQTSTEPRKPRSILFLSRMAPSKRPDMLIDALGTLKGTGVDFTATLVGSPIQEDQVFYSHLRERVHELGLDGLVQFRDEVQHTEAARVFRTHDIFVNTSRSGMFDKTIFEAAASGCLVLATSDDFHTRTSDAFHFTNGAELAERLHYLLSMQPEERAHAQLLLKKLVDDNSIEKLIARILEALEGSK